MKKVFKIIIQFYLKLLTKITLKRHRPLVVAIAGITNKTFVKEMILNELGRGPEVRGNPKSFNTEIGLPLAVLFLPSGYASIFRWVDVLLTGTCVSFFSKRFPKVLVLEMGVDKEGDMDYLLSMVNPQIAVITDINESFYETNSSREKVTMEIAKLVDKISEKGVVILNGEDKRVSFLAKQARSRVVKFGWGEDCESKNKNVQSDGPGQAFEVEIEGKTEKGVTDRYGKHNIEASVIAKIVKKEIKKMRNDYQKKKK